MAEKSLSEKSDKPAKIALSKDILQIIRTTMRNNIELTHIADNKANVLLSLNSLILTFLIPLVLSQSGFIREHGLLLPLIILIATSFVTIFISAQVLKPGKFFINQKSVAEGHPASPFFFGNYYKMSRPEFHEFISDGLSSKKAFKSHIADDLHYVGSRLGKKMTMVRNAFNIFITGIFISISLALILIFT